MGIQAPNESHDEC